jgi:hypothetical protein
MFFVSEGGLHVLNEENDDIQQRIGRGGFVGELGLITQVKRV